MIVIDVDDTGVTVRCMECGAEARSDPKTRPVLVHEEDCKTAEEFPQTPER